MSATPPDLLRRAAEAAPERVAIEVAGGERLTYGEWWRDANRAAGALRRAGIGPGDRLALRFDGARWPRFAVAHVAAHAAGAVPVPLLSTLGPIELERVLAALAPSAIVAPDDLAPDAGPRVLGPAALDDGGPVDGIAASPPSDLEAPAELLCLSGPLSRPVFVSSEAETPPLGDGPLLHAFPIATIAAHEALFAALRPPRVPSLVLPALDPDRLRTILAGRAVGALGLHVAAARALLDEGLDEVFAAVTHVLLAGGPIDAALVEGLAVAFPSAEVVRRPDARPEPENAPAHAAPVAFSQEGMLWHELFAPGCQNLPGLARRYRGPLDVAALERALDEIERRHEPLRSGFELRDGVPVHVVRPHRRRALAVEEVGEEDVGPRVREAGRRPFDLVCEDLFQPTLLRLADDDHVLVIRTHHSAFDDWSVGVFRRELAALYAAYAAGEASPLPEPPLRFGDFCRRRRERLGGAAGEREMEFWRRELAGAPLATQLPVEDPTLPPGAPQPAGEPVSLTLEPALCERLRALARRERVTLHMVLLTAFGVLVRRCSGQDDLLLSTVVADRDRSELEGLIGCFTKKVPLRLRLMGDPTFAEALKRSRSALLGALAHGRLPFDAILQEVLGPPAAAHGLVPHPAVVFQGVTPEQELVLPDVDSSGLRTAATAARSHFMARGDGGAAARPSGQPWGAGLYRGTFAIVSVDDRGSSVACTARGAFHVPAMRALLGGFRDLLAAVAAGPGRTITELAGEPEAPSPSFRGFPVDRERMRAALLDCPGVEAVAIAVERDGAGEPALVADVVPAGEAPTLARLQRFLWERLPGYAWPSAVAGARDRADAPFEEHLLAALWGSRGAYSQDFSFVDALVGAREAGLAVPARHVTRNRTVTTLAAAMAVERASVSVRTGSMSPPFTAR